MSFKIIALEILDGCDTSHSKNLIISKKERNETIELLSEDVNLYSKDGKLKINISAIV